VERAAAVVEAAVVVGKSKLLIVVLSGRHLNCSSGFLELPIVLKKILDLAK
jgi:hypothetical protein